MRMKINVECYSGYRVDEIPRRIKFKAHTVDVREIIDRWLSPDHRYFKIKGDDNAEYIIRYDTQKRNWELTFYRTMRRNNDP
jgi:hypothetical protein